MKKAYYFEVGVKTEKEDSEGRFVKVFEFDFNIIDENYGETQTLKEALEYVEDYVQFGVNGTYGIIFIVDVEDEEYNMIHSGFSDAFEYGNFFDGQLLYSVFKENEKTNVLKNNILKLIDDIRSNNLEDRKFIKECIENSNEPYFTEEELHNRYEEFKSEIDSDSTLNYEQWKNSYLDMTNIPLLDEEEEAEL